MCARGAGLQDSKRKIWNSFKVVFVSREENGGAGKTDPGYQVICHSDCGALGLEFLADFCGRLAGSFVKRQY
jgi:hypothetical protein